MAISDDKYLIWNKMFAEKKFFGGFFIFWGIYSVIFFGAAYAYLLGRGEYKIFLLSLASGLVAHYVGCKAVHFFHNKSHPYQRLKFLPPKSWLFSFTDGKLDAFPSEHSATSAAMAIAVYHFNPLIGTTLLGVTFVMGLARIVLGYHDFYEIGRASCRERV